VTLRIPSASEYEDQVLFSADQIAGRMADLGQEISLAYPDGLLIIANQRASLIFLADLVRQIQVPVDYDFVDLGRVTVDKETPVLFVRQTGRIDIKDRDVLLLTDIVRSGFTMHFLMKELITREPKSLEVCTLLHNPDQQLLPIPIKFSGFRTNEKSCCGYGMAYEGQGRRFPDIVTLVADAEEDEEDEA
jgi:hypoxanthine phosphoribosyltransferase